MDGQTSDTMSIKRQTSARNVTTFMMAYFRTALLVIKKNAFFGILSYRWRSLIYAPQTTQPINM